VDTQQRIAGLVQLGEYIQENGATWQAAKDKAFWENGWFIPEFVDKAAANISHLFLQREALESWVAGYGLSNMKAQPKTIGMVMAGNIPLVGFHDFLCGFISGHHLAIKLSLKDRVLLRHLVEKLIEWMPDLEARISFQEQLKGCDAYIATGSSNTGRYFEYYFARFPHIIRRNRTSVAVLDGNETEAELSALADDVMLYFGLGCRNVTQVYVPQNYDFVPLLSAMRKYSWVADHNKYKNNYDYNLSLLLLNHRYYMTNETVLMAEEPSPFSPISQLNYQYYDDKTAVLQKLQGSTDVQAVVGHNGVPFGEAQIPTLPDYADGVDTMAWLKSMDNGRLTTDD
jgi:hypothetical protein